MKQKTMIGIAVTLFTMLPTFLMAQSIVGNEVSQFHTILENLYDQMLPLASNLTGAAIAIAGFGALWYIGVRVWKHLAAAEPVDFFPLFRPFVITLLIINYPIVIAIMNGVLYPTVAATEQMVKNSNNAVSDLLNQRAKAITQNAEWQTLSGGLNDGKEDWHKYENQDDSGGSSLGSAVSFSISLFTNGIMYICKYILSIILQLIYYAASLCIDAIRVFELLILALLGPFVLGISVFDGFQKVIVSWISRYINVYLWLPIANLFGAMIGVIEQGILKMDLSDITAGNLVMFGETSMAYLIFLIIAIVGYIRVPHIANYVIHTAGGSSIGSKIARVATMVVAGM